MVAGVALSLLGSPVLAPAAQAAPTDDESSLRIGVLALAGAISAVGQTPELSAPLPFTTTSVADVLELDERLTADLTDALAGEDLVAALDELDGVTILPDDDEDRIAFTYSRTVEDHALPLVHDDGDLRFGDNPGAGELSVSLTTRASDPFVVQVDENQPDPLLRVGLVSQPVLDLAVDIETDDLAAFPARQGFTEIDVTGGHYRIHRDQQITMRDPDGRGLLTLEDLRYSTLPDLFRIMTANDEIDLAFRVRLPGSLTGGSDDDRTGTLSVDATDTPEGAAWPTAEDASRAYGPALARATGLSMVDGLTSLAQYTGSVLALQDAADVPFPNLGGGTADLFAPGDRLLDLLSTAAAAQIRCGVAPESPPTGIAAPGDTVYCTATTAEGLGTLGNVTWSTNGGDGTVVSDTDAQAAAVGTAPTGVVRIDGSDGEPDVSVSFTAGGQELTARSMPHTVQDVVRRIEELPGSQAGAALSEGRLDVSVDVTQATGSKQLPLGNPGTLGALVGLTGLASPDPDHPARATATATDASFDVGFGIQTGTPDPETGRQTFLLPSDDSLFRVGGVSATPPTTVTDLPGRIGFLGVTADLTGLGLGTTAGDPAVVLARAGGATGPLLISDLLTGEGALDPDQLSLDSHVTASIAFTATEDPLTAGGSDYASGSGGPATGSASVEWNPSGLPEVVTDAGYQQLRVFDPVPAAFLSGTARVTEGATANDPDSVAVDIELTEPATLYSTLNVTPPTGGEDVEVARRLVADGLACQNVTLTDADTLTCEELAPNGTATWTDGQPVQLIVLGDPFALRDSVIEGLSAGLTSFDRLTGDNRDEGLADDQYTSTLPLVDLTPAQLAVERQALQQGLSAMVREAAEDEANDDDGLSVSSAQELEAAIGRLVKVGGSSDSYRPSLSYTLGDRLGVQLTARSPVGETLTAPLRFTVNGPGQVGSGDTFDVGVSSSTTLAIDVEKDTARPAVAEGTGTTSTTTLGLGPGPLDGTRLQAGIGDLSVTGAGSSADLGVTVHTEYVEATDGSGRLETTRTNARAPGRAAVADLVVGEGQTLHYEAAATDSSGGTGAEQPAPEAMQVKYVAEGLDGLAAALGDATDGAAPRNLGEGGVPVSAPLIGTNLDAGADVAGTLTGLTSQLRDELEKDAVADATTAAELETALGTAAQTAVNGAAGLADVGPGDITVDVTCGGTDGACDPCPEPEPGEEPATCTTDGPTGWETVSIGLDLTGLEKVGKTPFDTGLAGLEVRSNKDVDTTTSWTLPVTLQLQRGVGPQVVIGEDDALDLDVFAKLPDEGLKAIVGYLPAQLTAGSAHGGSVHTVIDIAPEPGTYDLFDLYDGELTATPTFDDPNGHAEDGITLDFETLAGGKGGFDLSGNIDLPWTAEAGFADITYNDVKLDVGEVVSAIATPFAVVDPYLAPVRDVVDVLRTPIPVISDLSELAGGGEVSLLSLLETLSAATQKPQLELAHRVIGLIDGVTGVMHGLAQLAEEDVDLESLSTLGTALTVDPREVALYESCTQTVTTTKPGAPGAPATTKKSRPKPCPDTSIFANQQKRKGAANQTTNANRTGTRNVKQTVARKTREVTGSLPGFSLPFLADPNQLMDMVTGEGEASYFRLDLGTLAAQVAYTQRFGPIMAGPVPIMPFVGGSISVEGRMAMGFDSHAQTLAVESLSDPGDVDELLARYDQFDGGDIIREGFYLDDLDADGVDVPEVKIVTTLEAGAGVSIGIVTAGLKGGITLTINLDLNDPDDDGRLRTAEIRTIFDGNAKCIFDASAELEAFISVFVEIQLLLTTLNYDFDLLRLGPYTLFEYGCPDVVPTLVTWDGPGNRLLLTSGERSGSRLPSAVDAVDEYEVRQFDRGGGRTAYEVSGFGRVQLVEVAPADSGGWTVTVYESGINISTASPQTYAATAPPTFVADGGNGDDKLSFLQGEAFTDAGELRTTPFSTRVASLTGGIGDDVLVTGDGNDDVDGEEGADSIDTGLGDDTATGGPDNDIVTGGAGRDDLKGGEGNDRVQGGPGGDRANGEGGDDSLVGGPGRDVRAVLVLPADRTADDDGNGVPDVVEEQVRLGFDSGDVLVGGAGADNVDGGDGSDVVVGGDAASLTGADVGVASLFETRDRTVNVLEEGHTNPAPKDVGQDTAKVPTAAQLDPLCESGEAESGAGTSDFVTGGPEADVVIGGNGADRLDGGAGPDEICGRAGDDQASGDGAEEGDDTDDVIRGGHGDDRADGGPGDDVMFGDDVVLVRTDGRVLDGSLGPDADGNGADYLDGGDGDDVLGGGGGSDLLLGDLGDDAAYGEGRDTAEGGGAAPSVSQRLLACNPTTRVVNGKIDLDGDLLAGSTEEGVARDTGRLAGLPVTDGVVGTPGASTAFDGLLGTDVVVIGGLVDLDRDGRVGSADGDGGDTGMIGHPSMLDTAAGNADGDCILAGDGNDDLLGGTGSDYVGAGDGTDLASGGDGNDLVLGDDGVDVVLGGPHHDVLVGGLGDDHLQGEDGDDRLRGNEGADDLVGGSDESGAADGQDVLLGGRQDDVLVAENAAPVSDGIVAAVTDQAVPWRTSGQAPGAVTADGDSALRFDDSALFCGDEPPDRWLTLLAHDGVAGTPAQSPGTPLAYDELYGGYDCDWVFGSTGDDLVRGGQDDDVVEAGPGADLAQGDDGNDVVLGGSSVDPAQDKAVTTDRSGAGVPDRGDTIDGDGGPDGAALDGSDLVVGDNALPVRLAAADAHPGPDYTVELHDVVTVSDGTPAASTSGADHIDAGSLADRVFGQGGDDTVDAGSGDDYVEGNAGSDTLAGSAGADDLVGGSSAADALPLGSDGLRLGDRLDAAPYDATAADLPDGDDTIDGGDGADVALGDNGRITRPDDATPTVRDIALTDEADASLAAASGDDDLTGGTADDRLFGEDGNDAVDAGDGADHAEGNSGADGITGGPGTDTVIGGTSVSPADDGVIGELPEPTIPDGNDVIYGDEPDDLVAASDLLFGDNATVLTLDSGEVVAQLADVPDGAAAAAGTSGDDTIDGGGAPDALPGAPDHVFGQGGDDTVTTGAVWDYVEGNSGDDMIDTGSGDDDVVGGSSATDGRPFGLAGTRLRQRMTAISDSSAAAVLDGRDEVHGGLGADTVLGDNGRITRPTDGERPVPDVAMADATAGDSSGSDALFGDGDDDVLYGQLDDGDQLATGDRVEGGDGGDTIVGDLAVITRTPAEDYGGPRSVAVNSEAITEDIYPSGTMVPVAEVPGDPTVGGPDLALGGSGDDVLRLGGGADLANGDGGADVVFGGDGNDAVWGGTEHDRLFGGYGDDDLDLKVRDIDPDAYDEARGSVDEDSDEATTNGADLAYGGWGADELQSDVGGAGPADPSDHLVDWVGAHNVYYVCGGAYGTGRVIRQTSPDMVSLLLELSRAAGDRDVETSGSGGWYDLGLVDNGDISDNTRRSPEYPGNFTCG